MKRTMQIGEMAQATGLSRDTLRFYEKQGLLRARRASLPRLPARAADWLRYLRTAQQLGFTLAEIDDMPLLAERRRSPPRRNCCARRWRASWAISMRASRA
jgi:DNA-binding transcriptional MerR regulator